MASSLLGTFTGATTSTAGATSSTRTTTADSLIVVASTFVRATTIGTSVALTGRLSAVDDGNTYTDIEKTQSGDRIRMCMGYTHVSLGANNRGASHDVTSTGSGGSGTIGHTVNGAEFDGIATAPTVVSTSTNGAGATWTGSISTTVTSLVVCHINVDNTSRPPTVTDGTQAIQTNPNARPNTTIGYKITQASGTPAIGGTIADSQTWEMILWSFEEAGAATGHPTVKRFGGIPFAYRLGAGVW